MKEQPNIEQTEKIEDAKKYEHVKLAIDESLAGEKDYAFHQAKIFTIPIEAFEKTYSNETERLKRIDELAKIYKVEFAKQEANPENKGVVYCSKKAMDHIFKSVLSDAEKQELKNSCKAEEIRQLSGQKEGMKVTWKQPPETALLRLIERVNTAEKKLAKTKEKEERPKHEIELEQRPEPLEGEAFDVWLERIGGPNVKLLESLKKYKVPKSKEKTPLIINKNGNFVLNSENIDVYFDKEKLDEKLAKEDPNISYIKKRGEYRLKKELFHRPEAYRSVIVGELKKKHKIVADKKFGKSLEKWTIEPEAKEKEPTLEEKIAQKEKELEEAKQKYNIYYSPVVKDMLGLYYEKQVKDLTSELKELRKGYKKEEKVEKKKEKEETEKTGAVGGGGGIGMEESAEDIENRLQELSVEIQTSSVLGRSKLEKKQKRLEKRLKKIKKIKK